MLSPERTLPLASTRLSWQNLHRQLRLGAGHKASSHVADRQREVHLSAAWSPGVGLPDPAVDETDLLELGAFGAPHGVRGEVKLFATTDSPAERLCCTGTRYVMPRHGGTQRRVRTVAVEGSRQITYRGREVWLLKLRGMDDPEAVEELAGQTLFMHASERPALADKDEFYVQELVGMQVILQETGQSIGVVLDLYDGTGTHDVLRVHLFDEPAVPAGSQAPCPPLHSRTALVPFAAEIVPVVDRAQRRMEIRPPQGLLDLAARKAPKPAKRRR